MNIGDQYGKLTIIDGPFSMNGRRFKCRCECGHEPMVNVTQLNHRAKTGGGCAKCSRVKHGHGRSSDPTYSKYQAMKQRCLNPKHVSYANYGGRGVRVCERWLNSFESFLADMGECPAASSTIERKDSNGDYTPANCIWLDKSLQAENTSRCRKVEVDGLNFKTVGAAATHFGVPPGTARQRIKYGWSIERAVKTPVDTSKRKRS